MKTCLSFSFCTTLIVAGTAYGQTPSVSNARFETKAVTGDALASLHSLIHAESGPAWFGYAIASNRSDDESCCRVNDYRGCQLEDEHGQAKRIGQNGPVQLEGSRSMFVLFRVKDQAIGKIQPVSGACPVDAGGLRFTWLTGMDEKASIAFLSEQVRADSGKQLTDSALVAIAMHAGNLADESLERFAGSSQPEEIREKALFWLASSRGTRGCNTVNLVAEHDSSEHLREKMMFDLSLCKDPAAIDGLIRFAKQDPAAGVRGQALFWLGQKAGNRAVGAIKDAVANDPDTEVKKKAVFALQNLPKEQGVPLLIETAKTNRNPEVRKQAMFWLGQSGDPRALAYFEEVLGR